MKQEAPSQSKERPGKHRRLRSDTRAVSSIVATLLGLAVLTSVAAATVVIVDGYTGEVKTLEVENRADSVGQSFANSLQEADQITRIPSTSMYSKYQQKASLPERIKNQQYRLYIRPISHGQLTWNENHTGLKSVTHGTYRVRVITQSGIQTSTTVTLAAQARNTSIQGGEILLLRPSPTESNVNSGDCTLYETNDQSGLQTIDDVSNSDEEPDTCRFVLQEANS